MPYHGHRPGCSLPGDAPRPREEELYNTWWVCTTCMPDFVPTCGICGAAAPVVGRDPNFVGYAYANQRLCPACIRKVWAAGHWRWRRPAAVAARRDLLRERYPTLEIVKETEAVTQLEGEIRGRRVEIRLRTKTREFSEDRYIFHVERDPAMTGPRHDDLGLPERLIRNLAWGSPTFTQTRVPWLRVAFLHLGKLDVATVLEALLDRVGAPLGDVPPRGEPDDEPGAGR